MHIAMWGSASTYPTAHVHHMHVHLCVHTVQEIQGNQPGKECQNTTYMAGKLPAWGQKGN